MAESSSSEARRGSWRLALIGVGAGGLATLATTHHLFVPTGVVDVVAKIAVPAGGQVPAATALGLVVLAGWGVLLVTRGRWRRAAATVAALAAAGQLGVTVAAWWTVPPTVRAQLAAVGETQVGVGTSPWWWIALAAAAASLLALLATWRALPHWPEMGRRYDAPAAEAADASTDPESARDIWVALDEGRDPTSGQVE